MDRERVLHAIRNIEVAAGSISNHNDADTNTSIRNEFKINLDVLRREIREEPIKMTQILSKIKTVKELISEHKQLMAVVKYVSKDDSKESKAVTKNITNRLNKIYNEFDKIFA
jgi:hypothetical protein